MPQPNPAHQTTSPMHFRLVPEDDATTDTVTAEQRVPSMISDSLIVSEAEFAMVAHDSLGGHRLACAEVPLIASLARIRSEADAAIALTGVIETLARRFQIALPCGALQDGLIGLIVPAKVNLPDMAKVIDDALLGQVRATDLQGALKTRMEARVTPMTPV